MIGTEKGLYFNIIVKT